MRATDDRPYMGVCGGSARNWNAIFEKDSRGRRVACPAGKNVDNVFKDEMSNRISPAFAVTEGKVHLALPENCPYKGDLRFE